MGRKTSIYLGDGLDAAVKASGRSIPELLRSALGPGAVPGDTEDRLAAAEDGLEELSALVHRIREALEEKGLHVR